MRSTRTPKRATPRLPTEESFGYQVRRSHRRFDRLLSACLARHGLKVGYWYYLRVLWIQDGLTQKELSRMTNVTENTTASLIEGMIKEGLVTRERDLVDRRKMCVSLTPKGRQLESELMGYAIWINQRATQGIDARDLEVCSRVLTAMSENLQLELNMLEDDDDHGPRINRSPRRGASRKGAAEER